MLLTVVFSLSVSPLLSSVADTPGHSPRHTHGHIPANLPWHLGAALKCDQQLSSWPKITWQFLTWTGALVQTFLATGTSLGTSSQLWNIFGIKTASNNIAFFYSSTHSLAHTLLWTGPWKQKYFSQRKLKCPHHLDTFVDRSCVVTIEVTMAVTIGGDGVEAGSVTIPDHLGILANQNTS